MTPPESPAPAPIGELELELPNRVGLHAYLESRRPELAAVPWHSLLCALIRGDDSSNFARLEAAFPAEVREVRARYNAPGGRIGAETLVELETEESRV